MKPFPWKTVILASALALGACAPLEDPLLGLPPGGGTGLYAGNGVATDPYVMPAEFPAGTTGGMEDYFAAGGFWSVGIGSIIQNYNPTVTETLDRIVYDADSNKWTITVSSPTFGTSSTALIYDAGNGSYFWCGAAGCLADIVQLDPYDVHPLTSQYGTFGSFNHLNVAKNIDVHAYYYTGMATPAADMPVAGTATYTGAFEAVNYDTAAGTYERTTGGQISALADFGAFAIGISTTTAGTFASTGDTYSFSVTAGTIASGGVFARTGNTFTGTADGSYYNTATTITHTFSGAMEGGFYGPAANEIAGAFDSTSATMTTTSITGGFWGTQ